MRSVRIILAVIILLVSANSLRAQEAVFSQFYSSALYLNPALAGVEGETFFGVNYRSQWSSLSLPFNTFQASFIQPVFNGGMRKKHLGGFGASVLNDVAGPNREFTTQSVSVSAAWNIHLSPNGNHIISLAAQGGISQQKVNYDNLRWSSQYSAPTGYDSSIPGEASMANLRLFRPIFNTGLIWSYNTKKHQSSKSGISFYNGFTVSNLIKANSYFPGSDGQRSLIFKVHGGLTAPIGERFDISPNYLYVTQGVITQINIGTYGGYSMSANRNSNFRLIGGAWYRINDGMIYSAGVSTKKISVAFSYDNNMASMGKTFGAAGAYEFSVAYRIPGKNNFKRISSPLI